jgi:hypothetical protein
MRFNSYDITSRKYANPSGLKVSNVGSIFQSWRIDDKVNVELFWSKEIDELRDITSRICQSSLIDGKHVETFRSKVVDELRNKVIQPNEIEARRDIERGNINLNK